MLEIRDLHVTYGATRAVRGLALAAPRGEIVALLGPNGAGKSSVLAAASGLVRPRSGEVLLDGFPITSEPVSAIVRRGLIHVTEGDAGFGSLTAEENLLVGAHWRRGAEIRADLGALYERWPALGDRRRTPAASLSSGERRLLVIARAVMARPRLLLLDEPSSGLAPSAMDEVFAWIAELRRNGLTILLVEQHVRRALAIAQYAYVLAGGRVALAGPANDLSADPRLQPVYLGGSVEGVP
jgi:branched-chain amino acid transport system ATP-binding protein